MAKPNGKQGSRQQVPEWYPRRKQKNKKRILYACTDAITDALNSGNRAASILSLPV